MRSSSSSANTVGDVGAGGTLGRYELLLPVARGGMAVVWAARQRGGLGFQKLVALKAMLPDLSDDPRIEEMFLAEARFASQIKHPHVCSVLDLGEQDGHLYLVMEWVDGETVSSLQKRSQDGALPIALATRIAIDAATGLHAAHELESDSGERIELVHRDVSPQNILVTHDGVVKIVDFGVAKATAQAWSVQTESGLLKGKIAFMSPEQAAGEEVDRRTDVFALGLVLYQMITGKHPFRSDTPTATLERIRTAPVTPPRELTPACPQKLSDAILKALEKDPTKRFQTMLELVRALDRGLAEIRDPEDGEDLAAFVRGVAGERIERRRAALKEAIRDADRQVRDPVGPAIPRPPASVPTLDETTLVSEPTLMSGAGAREAEEAPRAPSVAPVTVPRRAASRKTVASFAAIGATAICGLLLFGRAASTAPAPLQRVAAAFREPCRAAAAGTAVAPSPAAAVSFSTLDDAGHPAPPVLVGRLPTAPSSSAAPPAKPAGDAPRPALPTVRDPGF